MREAYKTIKTHANVDLANVARQLAAELKVD